MSMRDHPWSKSSFGIALALQWQCFVLLCDMLFDMLFGMLAQECRVGFTALAWPTSH